MDCQNWLCNFIIEKGPVAPLSVYAAGAEKGFTRKEIRAMHRWYGRYIRTETIDGRTYWRWNDE